MHHVCRSQAEVSAIRLLPAGEERARATRRLLSRYHPSHGNAAVSNPALQWCVRVVDGLPAAHSPRRC
jgi:hypothetical protein